MKLHRRVTVLAATTAAAFALAACTPDAPEPSVTPSPSNSSPASEAPSPTPSASATPSPSPTALGPATATPAEGWTEGSTKAHDEAAADPNVTKVVGVWTDPSGTAISIVETANTGGTVDAEIFFQESFGSLGAEDGVDVAHSVTTTQDGLPLLTVGITPAGGLGGDAQAMFYVLTPETVVAGVATTSADAFGATMEAMEAVGKSVRFE